MSSFTPRRSYVHRTAALAFAALPLVVACGAAEPDEDDEDAVPSEYAQQTADGKSFSALFRDTSTMRGDSHDWDPCRGKATCAAGEAITGMSEEPGGQARAALCTSLGAGSFTGEVKATLTLDARSDQRRANRSVNGSSDWDPGYWKLECGSGEYVSAVSEEANQCSGNNRFHAVRCARGSSLDGGACQARAFDQGDNRGSQASGDWDFGAYKGECKAGEYVAGVSVSPGSGAPHALLCCPAAGGSSGGGGVTKGDPFYGVSIDQASWGPEQAKLMRSMGAGLVRIQFCDWPAQKGALDAAVNAALAAGVQVYAELNYCTLPGYGNKEWHAGFTDAGNDFSWKFSGAAAEIAEAFKGRIYAYEIWNEPNAAPRPLNFPTAYWPSPENADWNGACDKYTYGADYEQSAWALCPRQLGVITTNAFMAIKGRDGGAKVVAGNMLFHGEDGWVAKEYWKQVEKSPAVAWHKGEKGRLPWDYVGIHPYGYKPTDGGLKQQIQSFQKIVASFGDPAKTALTEIGWTTGSGDPNAKTSEGTQATYLKATFQVAKELGLPFVSWFNYLDGGGINFGFRREDKGWKPAAKAFCEVASAPSCPVK